MKSLIATTFINLSLVTPATAEIAYKVFNQEGVSRVQAAIRCRNFSNGSLARVTSRTATRSIGRQIPHALRRTS